MKREDQRPDQGSAAARPNNSEDQKIFEDIAALNNELTTAQRELARRNAELVRLNEQKNHLLGVAAHDLRNPLGAIFVSSEYLLDELKHLSDDQLEMLRAIKSSSEFMLQLIEDILHLAKLEAGKPELRIESTDLAELTARHVAVNRQLAARKNIRIDSAIEPDLPAIEADSHKIEQVLENLISNAIKFSPPGTTVGVTLRRDGGALRIEVSDQGSGIPKGEWGKLFQPFQRTSVKPTGGEKSSGLGLSIARKMVEAHGGRIWFESEVGKGSTFFVSLPLHSKPPGPSSVE
ncbi:MAG: sensor histidine kinase [Candidatus Binataceae bacterium]